MKYNVGDKVIVKKDLKEGKVYNRIQFVGGMSKFKGKRLEIVNKNKRRYKTVYNLKGANFGFNGSIYYNFTKGMLKPVKRKIKRL